MKQQLISENQFSFMQQSTMEVIFLLKCLTKNYREIYKDSLFHRFKESILISDQKRNYD